MAEQREAGVDTSTGLAPGPEHDRMMREGTDYIVVVLWPPVEGEAADPRQEPMLRSNDSESLVYPDAVGDDLRALLYIDCPDGPSCLYSEWTRVRADSPEDALARQPLAHDQLTACINGRSDWQDLPLPTNGHTQETLNEEEIDALCER